tara:strand:- start:26 stop:433 length:408 start_codon:yes stop_codon:yes gene_type:complete
MFNFKNFKINNSVIDNLSIAELKSLNNLLDGKASNEDYNLLKNKTMKTKVINLKLSESNILSYWIQKLQDEGYEIISQKNKLRFEEIKVRNVKAFLKGKKVLENKILVKTVQKTLMKNEELDTVTLIAEVKSEVE